jgi:hypothetical protein
MGSNIPREFQKKYTWDAIVFSDGATYVASTRTRRELVRSRARKPSRRLFECSAKSPRATSMAREISHETYD